MGWRCNWLSQPNAVTVHSRKRPLKAAIRGPNRGKPAIDPAQEFARGLENELRDQCNNQRNNDPNRQFRREPNPKLANNLLSRDNHPCPRETIWP